MRLLPWLFCWKCSISHSNETGDLVSAARRPWLRRDWVSKWFEREPTSVPSKLHEMHGPNGAASGWQTIGASYFCKIVTPGVAGENWEAKSKDLLLASGLTPSVSSVWTQSFQWRLRSVSTIDTRVLTLVFSNMHPRYDFTQAFIFFLV